ncbi:MAG: SpoIIE family protein phosphatase [Acidobacteriia bacterium]|nr:SpoIIE family protein phosphatase [Terriglobia bacterium]
MEWVCPGQEFCFGAGASPSLVACTDGVSERSNLDGEFCGLGSLRSFVERNHHLYCPEFAGLLLKEVRQFGADAPLEDDLTLAVARFDAAPA